MTLEWSTWKKVDNFGSFLSKSGGIREIAQDQGRRQLPPYVHWSALGPGEDEIRPEGDLTQNERLSALLLQAFGSGATEEMEWFRDFEGLRDPLPIPQHATAKNEIGLHKVPEPSRLPVVDDEETVIAAIIDVGIPLGHWRTRRMDNAQMGETRILAAWQMLGEFQQRESDVPFGRELLKGEINYLLSKHSNGNLAGELDQDAFDRATDGLMMQYPGGQSDLARRSSHGAHVLDWAAGCDPFEQGDFSKKVAIMAVNAPSAATFGAGGTFLEQFLFHAIARIVLLSDAIWEKNFGKKNLKKKGFEIVINLAFGRQASAQESFGRFRKALSTFRDTRAKGWKSVHFVMPVGNDNQEATHAILEPKTGQTLKLNWHVPPQDQSSNFVELWTEDRAEEAPLVMANLCCPFGQVDMPQPPNDRNSWFYSDLLFGGEKLVARAYLQRICASTDGEFLSAVNTKTQSSLNRQCYIFCIAPTYRPTPVKSLWKNCGQSEPSLKPTGMAGSWKVAVTNCSTAQRSCQISIQTDQSLTPSRSINRRSFFEHSAYRRFDSMGRLLDSYSFPPDSAGRVINQDIETKTPIKRHGTMLAMTANSAGACIAGYRVSDGRPAFYSSTGKGRADGSDDGTELGSGLADRGAKAERELKRAPTAAFPTEESPALFGILGAGASDGSAVAMRGTSFATPQATRCTIMDILERSASAKSVQGRLFDLASEEEERRRKGATSGDNALAKTAQDRLIEVIGAGRINSPMDRAVDRRS